jgi:hypothetical protein
MKTILYVLVVLWLISLVAACFSVYQLNQHIGHWSVGVWFALTLSSVGTIIISTKLIAEIIKEQS